MMNQGKQAEVVMLPMKINKLPKYKGPLGFPKKDFRSLKAKLNIDTLIVISLPQHGAHRSYNSYIPVTDPLASVQGTIYTVDLATNRYLQFSRVDFKVNVAGEWDEPPSFPGVTNAYYEAVEKTKEHIQTLF